MVLLLPEASASIELFLSTMASSVTVRYYKDVFSNAINQNYALIEEVTKTKAELVSKLVYEAANHGGQYVSKIEIIPYNANQRRLMISMHRLIRSGPMQRLILRVR
jgi:adenine C2-methylase RlmN of 23S rRNA A2503 and tRNA A37